MKLTYALVSGTLVLLVGLGFMLFQASVVGGAAPVGTSANQRVATTTQVGPDEVLTVFTANSSCVSRVISTVDGTGQGITFTTGEPTNLDFASTSLTFQSGHFQAGSTTVIYDAGTVGCGQWSGAAEATTTIVISEFN
jgi:hypothetical protein